MRSFLAGSIVFLSVSGIGASAAFASAGHPETTPGIVTAGVDDFTFASFSADYYLDTDADGRSTLLTVETFVANFPDFDQNHGMRRAIPESYQDAPTDISVQSVTDENGAARPFTLETDDNGFLLVTSRDDGFVHGAQTYVFTYTQRNVTRYFENTDDDEFYWDTNGTGWFQPFASVSARVHVPTALAGALTGEAACYQGYEGSTDTCTVTSEQDADGTVFSAAALNLGAYQNMTVVVVFDPHTFVPRDDSYLGSPLGILQVVVVLIGVAAAIWAIILRATVFADGRGRPTIIAEYTPPKDLDLITASVLLRRTRRAAAAQFVDFAVKRRIRIIETPKQGWFATGNTYLLELVDPSGLDGPELNLAQALFGYQLAPGTEYLMSGKDATLSERVRGIIQSATSGATQHGLRKRGVLKHAVLPVLVALLAAVGAFALGIILLEGAIGGGIPALMFVPAFLALALVFRLISRTPLTAKGAELRDHLKGLELYIRLAEADRLQMLQSATGAEREPVSTSDPRVVIDLYEKLLPYAVLFRLEKEWAAELGKYYVDSPPEWYSGSGAFNAGVFASSISSMSTSAASSYSGSSSSSSSGGSGGGGSSGGGGGGGGGGGV
jgi:uncharacterized membrane protein YgcG